MVAFFLNPASCRGADTAIFWHKMCASDAGAKEKTDRLDETKIQVMYKTDVINRYVMIKSLNPLADPSGFLGIFDFLVTSCQYNAGRLQKK